VRARAFTAQSSRNRPRSAVAVGERFPAPRQEGARPRDGRTFATRDRSISSRDCRRRSRLRSRRRNAATRRGCCRHSLAGSTATSATNCRPSAFSISTPRRPVVADASPIGSRLTDQFAPFRPRTDRGFVGGRTREKARKDAPYSMPTVYSGSCFIARFIARSIRSWSSPKQ